jgi:putative inorganic carbon (hco3(-)) transporter
VNYPRRHQPAQAAVEQGQPGAIRRRLPTTAQRGGTVPGSRSDAFPALLRLRLGAIWTFLKQQRASFWLVCIYLFFEYVRPQQIYDAIAGPPYTKVIVILALVAFFLERKPVRFGLLEKLLLAFSVIVVLSCATAFDSSLAFGKLSDYLNWVVIYILIANLVDSEGRFLVFTLSFLLYSFKMSQHGTRGWAEAGFAFQSGGVTGAPGFFQNSGEFGVQMCVFLPIIVAFILGLRDRWPRPMRWFMWAIAATAITGAIGSSSRGALIGVAVVALWMLLKSRHKVRGLVVTVVLAGVVWGITPPEQKARFQSAGDDETSISRTTNWKHGIEMMKEYPVLGIGYGNWEEYHNRRYGTPLLPHNIFIEAGSQLGVSGLLAFVALIIGTFMVNARTRRLTEPFGEEGRFIWRMAHGLDGALVGYLASGFFVTVLFYPFFWINLALTAALQNAAIRTFARRAATSASPAVSRTRRGLPYANSAS